MDNDAQQQQHASVSAVAMPAAPPSGLTNAEVLKYTLCRFASHMDPTVVPGKALWTAIDNVGRALKNLNRDEPYMRTAERKVIEVSKTLSQVGRKIPQTKWPAKLNESQKLAKTLWVFATTGRKPIRDKAFRFNAKYPSLWFDRAVLGFPVFQASAEVASLLYAGNVDRALKTYKKHVRRWPKTSRVIFPKDFQMKLEQLQDYSSESSAGISNKVKIKLIDMISVSSSPQLTAADRERFNAGKVKALDLPRETFSMLVKSGPLRGAWGYSADLTEDDDTGLVLFLTEDLVRACDTSPEFKAGMKNWKPAAGAFTIGVQDPDKPGIECLGFYSTLKAAVRAFHQEYEDLAEL